jgi:hypothetical protein
MLYQQYCIESVAAPSPRLARKQHRAQDDHPTDNRPWIWVARPSSETPRADSARARSSGSKCLPSTAITWRRASAYMTYTASPIAPRPATAIPPHSEQSGRDWNMNGRPIMPASKLPSTSDGNADSIDLPTQKQRQPGKAQPAQQARLLLPKIPIQESDHRRKTQQHAAIRIADRVNQSRRLRPLTQKPRTEQRRKSAQCIAAGWR